MNGSLLYLALLSISTHTLCLLHCSLSLVSSAWFVVCLFAVLSLCCTVLNALSHTQLEWITLQPLQQPQQEGQLFLVYFSYLYFIEGCTQKFPCRLSTIHLCYNCVRTQHTVVVMNYVRYGDRRMFKRLTVQDFSHKK